ncbi:MAG: 2OG-Fe dioxygenase family protein [Polaromonas sp.]|nr:2OG-Fe dioxygenase family protein [Polaromonas sp.]
MFSIPTTPKPAAQALQQDGLCLLQPGALSATLGLHADWHSAWQALTPSWQRLPPDAHLKDGGHYRQRRHSCFVQQLASAADPAHPVHHSGESVAARSRLTQTPQRAHWQPTDYNALHGGILRWFEPMEPAVASSPTFTALLTALGRLFAEVRPVERWYIESHQFRIDTAGGVGRPTPEGAHRDGVDFVVVLLVGRHEVKGGETRVFDANGPHGVRFVMAEPLSALLLDDARVIHETTPILPATPDAVHSFRDTLVLTYRAAGFQQPA